MNKKLYLIALCTIAIISTIQADTNQTEILRELKDIKRIASKGGRISKSFALFFTAVGGGVAALGTEHRDKIAILCNEKLREFGMYLNPNSEAKSASKVSEESTTE
jgi:hypothetical protein